MGKALSYVEDLTGLHMVPSRGIISSLTCQSELFLCRPQIQFMRPQCRLLSTQPQIRFTNTLSTHRLTIPRILIISISYATIRDGMDHMDPILRHLLRHGLAKRPNARPPGPIRCKFRVRPQRPQRPRKDDRALLLPIRIRQQRLPSILRIHHPARLLPKRKRTRSVRLQALTVRFWRGVHERLLRAVLDVEDGEAQFQIFEVGVRGDGLKGLAEGGGRGVGGESVECAVLDGGAQVVAQLFEVGGVAGEEGDGHVAFAGED